MSGRPPIPAGATARAVATNIAAARKARGLSSNVLSELLKTLGRPIAASAVTKIERGERQVTVDDLTALATALAVSPADLLDQHPCSTCRNAPPLGFTCPACGRSAPPTR